MSVELMKSSFRVLRMDKELLAYPLASGLCLILVLIAFVTPLYMSGYLSDLLSNTEDRGPPEDPVFYVLLLALYVANYFVITFFNTALISAALIRMDGRKSTLSDGFRSAWSRIGQIASWAIVAGSVGLLLKILEKRLDGMKALMAAILGLAWTLASYMVIPVLAAEGLYPLDALRRSSKIIRQRWGNVLVTDLGLGFLYFFTIIIGLIGIMAAVLWITDNLLYSLAAVAVYWILMALIFSALQGIVIACIYKYATSGHIPTGFQQDPLESAFRGK